MKNIPKFKEIENYIIDLIKSEELHVEDQIETEEQLCARFGVSRMTVNKAITNLADQGYIIRIVGKGSFVSATHISKQAGNPRSFTNDMLSHGMKPGSKLVSYEICRAKDIPDIQKKIKCTDDTIIHKFIRLRTGNNVPIAIQYSYVSANIVPAIDVSCLDHSFYEFLDSIGIIRTLMDLDIKATIPTEKQKELLHIKGKDIALLKVSHTTNCIQGDRDDVTFEYIETFYNSDMYSYKTITDGRLAQ